MQMTFHWGLGDPYCSYHQRYIPWYMDSSANTAKSIETDWQATNESVGFDRSQSLWVLVPIC